MKKSMIIRLTLLMLIVGYAIFAAWVNNSQGSMPKGVVCLIGILGFIAIIVHLVMLCIKGVKEDKDMIRRRRIYNRLKEIDTHRYY